MSPRLLFVEVNSLTLERAGATPDQLYGELARSGYTRAESIPDHQSLEYVVFTRADRSEARP